MGCGSNFSYFFFTTFILICGFLVLNLFVAVIMDNFDYLIQDRSVLGPHHLVCIIFTTGALLMHRNEQGDFVRAWGQFDPGGAGKLPQSQLLPLLRSPRKRKQLENIFSDIFRLHWVWERYVQIDSPLDIFCS